MTYENALEWAEESVDPLDYDSWEMYLQAVDDEFRNPFSSFMPDLYVQELHDFYDSFHENAEIEEPEQDH